MSDKTKQANLQRMNGFNPLFTFFHSKTLDLIIYNLFVYIATHIVILRTYYIYKYGHSHSWGSTFCSTATGILGQILSIITFGSPTHTDVCANMTADIVLILYCRITLNQIAIFQNFSNNIFFNLKNLFVLSIKAINKYRKAS